MKLGEAISSAQLSKSLIVKEDNPALFVIPVGNAFGGRSYAGFQPVAGKGLFGVFPYILKFVYPDMNYFDLLITDGWRINEDNESYEFFSNLVNKHMCGWDLSCGIDDIHPKLRGVAVVTYTRDI